MEMLIFMKWKYILQTEKLWCLTPTVIFVPLFLKLVYENFPALSDFRVAISIFPTEFFKPP